MDNISDQINNAIGAHGLWKTRLKYSIEHGKSDFATEQVRMDNLCEFGKWLYSCSAEQKKSPDWKNIKDLHGKFHAAAANVLELALKGKKKEAETELLNGNFSKVSNMLTSSLMQWKNSFDK
jgi:Chemoreceptor zinc-binding domain